MPSGLLYAITVAIWGSSWLGIKFQLGVVDPALSIAYRFTLAAVVLFLFCLATGRSLRFSARDHLYMAAQGVSLFGLNYWLFYLAGSDLTSGLLAVCFSTITVMNMANGALLFRQRVERRVVIGAALGLIGIGMVFWPEIAGFDVSSKAAVGLALSLVATYSASLGNMVTVRHKEAGVGVIEGNTIGMAYGAAANIALVLGTGAPLAFDFSWTYVVSLVYLSIVSSIIAFTCYLTLVQRIGADRAAYSSVLFPIVALGVSTVFEGYHWTLIAAAGVALVLLGNLVVLLRPRAPSPVTPAFGARAAE